MTRKSGGSAAGAVSMEGEVASMKREGISRERDGGWGSGRSIERVERNVKSVKSVSSFAEISNAESSECGGSVEWLGRRRAGST